MFIILCGAPEDNAIPEIYGYFQTEREAYNWLGDFHYVDEVPSYPGSSLKWVVGVCGTYPSEHVVTEVIEVRTLDTGS